MGIFKQREGVEKTYTKGIGRWFREKDYIILESFIISDDADLKIFNFFAEMGYGLVSFNGLFIRTYVFKKTR